MAVYTEVGEAELDAFLADYDIGEAVALKGVAEGVTALAAGQVEMIFGSFPATLPLYEARKIRMLAVSTLKRTAVMPQLPTVDEAGVPGYDRYGWYGVMAPAGTPKPVVSRLNGEILRALKMPEVKDRLENVGFELVGSSPEACGAYIKSEIAKWAKVVKASGVKAE